ncbi:MAG: tetratricopeptide repeat protein [Bacteroidales bacterium]|jgi:predicted Zn-dependent protease|nr:tetratricopeptide repeat protein [Bacteroidales bacterium]
MKSIYNKAFILLAFATAFVSCKTPQKGNVVQYSKERLEIDDLLLRALTQSDIGNNIEAEKLYNAVLDKDPDNAVAYSKMSVIAFSVQNWDKAEASAKKAVALSPDNIWYRIQLGQMYYVMRMYEQSADVYEQLIKRNPDRIELYQTLVEIYHQCENYDKMIQTLNRMEQRWGVSEEISMPKFSIYNMQDKKDKAEQEIVKLAKQYPDETKYNSILAEMAMQAKDYNKAYTYYRQVEESNPDDPFVQIALANYYLSQKNKTLCYEYLMRTAKNAGLDARTKLQVIISVYGEGVGNNREDFERFFSLLQEISKVNTSEGEIWALLSTGYLRKDDFENAVLSIYKAIELGEKDFDLYQNLLFAQSALSSEESNLDRVIAVAERTIELYPEQPLPYLFKGVNLMLKGAYPQAIAALHQGEKIVFNNKPMLVDFYANLAETYYKAGALDSSDYYFEKTIALDSTQYMSMNNYAYYLSLRNTNLDRAEALSHQVVTRFPQNHIYVDTYAWILYQKGRYQEAKQAMDKVLQDKQSWSQAEQEHYEAILKALENKP